MSAPNDGRYSPSVEYGIIKKTTSEITVGILCFRGTTAVSSNTVGIVKKFKHIPPIKSDNSADSIG